MITGKYPSLRLVEPENTTGREDWFKKNNLSSNDLIYPIFLVEGKK